MLQAGGLPGRTKPNRRGAASRRPAFGVVVLIAVMTGPDRSTERRLARIEHGALDWASFGSGRASSIP